MPGALPQGVERRGSRAAVFERASLNMEARTVELAFSSEQPVQRWWGIEILGHAPGEMDDGWLRGGTAPLLMDHNARDQVGVVESVTLGGDRKARAIVRFGKSARAEEVMQDVADGIRANVSVGYELLELRLESEAEGVSTYRATRWRPLEVSLVSLPADATVGVGREAEPPKLPAQPKQEGRMADQNEAQMRAPTQDEINQAAQKRIAEIYDLAAIANATDQAADAIRKGLTIEQFRGLLLEQRQGQSRPLGAPPTEIGLSAKEARQFSLARMILARAENNPSLAPFEVEASAAAADGMRKTGAQMRGGLVLPYEVMMAPVGLREHNGRILAGGGRMQRDLTTASIAAGGAVVQTDVLATNFIDLLRNSMMVRAMGATMLSGLVGNVAIPRQTGAASASWVAQGAAATESDSVMAQLALTPRTVHAIQDFTRELLLQSSLDVEALVRMDLAAVVGLAVDLAALHGTGAGNQPTGIAATAGIGSVAGGTNGAVPTWDNVVDLETQVANQNAAIEALGYLTNSRVRGRLKRQPIVAGQPVFVWGGMPGSDRADQSGFGTMNGYRAGVSNQVSSNLTKGTASGICSAIFFGNWRDLVIGEWGALEILTDNITQAASRVIRVHNYQTTDVGVRRQQSFSAMLDALTA
ncbi:phage major capsid protein [Roseococcus sp. SDR]|uniref:phage major capsid protein n=1 Tax=Roseococcus sp. SDR TaxID=2835532 RepID=UPI001BCFF5F1|nr:phage major capsid protein [Roseococcus sp. SDR]MBS7792173.1 phage major capsid protein [Roseococcus sp. SDR]MBV1847487.1 phage major capsid protein [Roseococcus sp. SDR]